MNLKESFCNIKCNDSASLSDSRSTLPRKELSIFVFALGNLHLLVNLTINYLWSQVFANQ